jgi:hypothetical protein
MSPLSIIRLFQEYDFESYWADTDPSQTTLGSILADAPPAFARGGDTAAGTARITKGWLAKTSPAALLFQTGYLALDGSTVVPGRINRRHYTLKVPNQEIEDLLEDSYPFALELYRCRNLVKGREAEMRSILKAIADGDSGRLAEELNAVFAGLDATLYTENQSGSFFNCCLATLFMMDSDVLTSPGQSAGLPDIVLKPKAQGGLVIVIELKYDSGSDDKSVAAMARNDSLAESQAKIALKTIYDKDYLGPYRTKATQLVPLGLGIAGRGRFHALFGDPSGPTVAGPKRKAQSKTAGKAPSKASGKDPAKGGKADGPGR